MDLFAPGSNIYSAVVGDFDWASGDDAPLWGAAALAAQLLSMDGREANQISAGGFPGMIPAWDERKTNNRRFRGCWRRVANDQEMR
jgi:hypothetical protein